MRNVSRLSARQIAAPVLWQRQFAVNEGMAQDRHVGEEDAHLTVLYLAGGPAVLLLHAGRVAAPFGKATFINDEHGKGGRRLKRRRRLGGGVQGLADKGAQFIAHPVVVPDGSREQALHAIRAELPGVFGDLPAIFAGDVAEDGLQVEQGMTAGLGACKVGSQTLLPPLQGPCPDGDLLGGWPSWRFCGMVRRLHAFLVSDGRTTRTRGMCSGSVSHLDEIGTKSVLIRGIFLGKCLTFKVPL